MNPEDSGEQQKASSGSLENIINEMDRKVFHLKTLYDISTDIFKSVDLKTILRNFLLMTTGNFGVIEGFILLQDTGSEAGVYLESLGFKDSDRALVLQNGERLLLKWKNEIQLIDGPKFENLNILPGSVKYFVPFNVQEECSGLLGIGNKISGEPYNDDDRELLATLVNNLAAALKNIKLTEALIKAERLAAIGEASASISHCMKNMLSGLEAAFMVFQGDVEDNYSEIPLRGCSMFERNIKRLRDFIQDMLTYSKERKPVFQITDLNELVDSIVELMRESASEKGVTLDFHADGKLENLEIDPKQIYRCVLNLVTNAIEASDKTGSCVNVKTSSNDSDYVAVEVSDQGIGMNEETKNRIFQPFFSKKGSKGTGLGLAITKKFIDEHNGKIEVISKEGEGCSFLIYLPVERN